MAPAPPDASAMPATADRQPAVWAAPVAGVLGWLVPGLGHLYLGQRARGLVCLVAITATFWTGVAIGSVHATVDPRERTLWFLAQLCTGGNTLIAYGWHAALTPPHNRDPHGASAHDHARTTVPHWLSVDVGVHYTGVAGLLNLLVILDALARAELMAPVGLRNSRVRKKGYP